MTVVCTPADVGMTFTDDAPAWLVARCWEYLDDFDPPREDNRCSCGSELTGFFGSFSWGLAHGEGSCTTCGRPARAVHYIKEEDGKDAVSFQRVLLYRLVGASDAEASVEQAAS